MVLNALADSGSHFFLSVLAQDVDNSDQTECPEALAFASIDGHKVTYQIPFKEALSHNLHSYVLGKAPLKDIVDAEINVKAVDDSKYDLTKNSCVHYAGAIWRELGFDETEELGEFLTENLLRDHGLLEIAQQKVAVGGLRVLSKYTGYDDAFEKYVKDTVISQLHIE